MSGEDKTLGEGGREGGLEEGRGSVTLQEEHFEKSMLNCWKLFGTMPLNLITSKRLIQ